MSKFDYMEFGYSAGSCDTLVFHAKKYTKEEVVDIFNKEYDYLGKTAKVKNVHDGYVKWFINPTEYMSGDFEGGCYGFVDKPGNGAFPVYTLELSELDESKFEGKGKIREVILKTAGMFDNYDQKLTDYELWKSIAEYMDGEKAFVVDHYTRDGTYTFLGLQDANKDKEYSYMREQDSMMGCYIDDRERFEKDWGNEEYEPDGLFILSAENVIISEPQEAHISHDLPGQQEGDKWNPVSFMLGTLSNKPPEPQEEIKGCSGECDFCPDADGCEQCGSV